MNAFLQRHADRVIGVLHGFDRLRFRGTLRPLAHAGGMMEFLWSSKVLLKDFGQYVLDISLENVDYGEAAPVLEMLHRLRMAEQSIDEAIEREANGAPACSCIITQHERQEQVSCPVHGPEIRRARGGAA